MSLIDIPIGDLAGGVSQQSPFIRRPDQSEESINCYFSVVDGLQKRPNTQYISRILSGTGASYDASIHTIDRGDGLIFHIVVQTGGITAYDATGGSVNVVDETSGFPYLTGATPKDDYKIVTVQDYTFIANRDRTPAMKTGLSPTGLYGTEAYMFCKQAAYNTTFSITAKLTGTTAQTISVHTWNGNAVAAGDLTVGGNGTTETQHIISGLITQATGTFTGQGYGNWFSYDKLGAVGQLYRTQNDLQYLLTTDGVSDSYLSTIYNQTSADREQTNSDGVRILPIQGIRNSFKLHVVGEAGSSADDYYIQFTGNSATGLSQGGWQETVAYSVPYQIDGTTMPHQLVLEQTGSTYQFRYKQVTWDDRTVGDTELNPDPSFISRPISDIFFFQDRLGIVAQDRILLSEQGEYFNFFRSTLKSFPDTERIDAQVSHNRVVNINHVVPYNKSLILFSDLGQFLIPGDIALTSKTIAAISVSEYETSRLVKPALAGRSIYMSYDNGNYAGIREFYQTTDQDTFDAIEITNGIPQYIKGNIVHMVVNTLENVLAVLADDNQYYLYIYKYVWNGNQKVVSSWGKWKFGDDTSIKVYSMSWINSDLYIIVKRKDGIYIEKITLSPGFTDNNSDFVTLLDRRLDQSQVSISYNEASNQSTIYLPYQTNSLTDYRVISKTGLRYEVKTVNTQSLIVRGNLTAINFWVGESYSQELTLTPPLVKFKTEGGYSNSASSTQKARKCSVFFKNSRFIKAVVQVANRTAYTYYFTGPALGDPDAVLGTIPLSDGQLDMSIMGQTDLVSIVLSNDSPFPSNLISLSYRIEWKARSTRWLS